MINRLKEKVVVFQFLRVPGVPYSGKYDLEDTDFDHSKHTYVIFHGYLGHKLYTDWRLVRRHTLLFSSFSCR